MTTAFRRLGLPPIVNAAGKLTALGGSAQSDEVADAQRAAAQAHVDLADLRARAGARVAELAGADAASIVPGAAAGIAISVAACIAGNDLERVRRLPNADGLPNGVLLQSGHDIDFGAPITQMIQLGGGRPIVVGTPDGVDAQALRDALRDPARIVAFLYVQSHHCNQQNRLSLSDCIAICHHAGVPVIVDAAAEEDLHRYVVLGADLVTYSGGKAFGGPTVGFIVGNTDRIAACELQQRGIARAMKVGKEQIAGLLVALERHAAHDPAAEAERRRARVRRLFERLQRLPRVTVQIRSDEAGRDIERIAIAPVDGDVRALVAHLQNGTPSIRTRNHHLKEGYVLIDLREVADAQLDAIVARVAAYREEDR